MRIRYERLESYNMKVSRRNKDFLLEHFVESLENRYRVEKV
jgi:hypothetical protein